MNADVGEGPGGDQAQVPQEAERDPDEEEPEGEEGEPCRCVSLEGEVDRDSEEAGDQDEPSDLGRRQAVALPPEDEEDGSRPGGQQGEPEEETVEPGESAGQLERQGVEDRADADDAAEGQAAEELGNGEGDPEVLADLLDAGLGDVEEPAPRRRGAAVDLERIQTASFV